MTRLLGGRSPPLVPHRNGRMLRLRRHPTVASNGGKRYFRVGVGRYLAGGDPVGYDQNPADDERHGQKTDCRGSGIHDCPCEADGPDSPCTCCRRGDQNGSCRGA